MKTFPYFETVLVGAAVWYGYRWLTTPSPNYLGVDPFRVEVSAMQTPAPAQFMKSIAFLGLASVTVLGLVWYVAERRLK